MMIPLVALHLSSIVSAWAAPAEGPAGLVALLTQLPPSWSSQQSEPGSLRIPVLDSIPEVEPPPAPSAADDEPRPAPLSIALFWPAPPFEPPPKDGAVLDSRHRDARGLCPCGCVRGDPAGAAFAVRGHTFSAAWIERTLHGVIANECQSKSYTDIEALDGGTVGICHFASGSLKTLYGEMNTARYFGMPRAQIPDRPYRFDWWREGMRRFLSTPEARAAQQRAWRAYISPALGKALDHGWASHRELTIAASVANSLGSFGFQQLAEHNHWRPEETLKSYARMSAHKERRRQRLDQRFPLLTTLTSGRDGAAF